MEPAGASGYLGYELVEGWWALGTPAHCMRALCASCQDLESHQGHPGDTFLNAVETMLLGP